MDKKLSLNNWTHKPIAAASKREQQQQLTSFSLLLFPISWQLWLNSWTAEIFTQATRSLQVVNKFFKQSSNCNIQHQLWLKASLNYVLNIRRCKSDLKVCLNFNKVWCTHDKLVIKCHMCSQLLQLLRVEQTSCAGYNSSHCRGWQLVVQHSQTDQAHACNVTQICKHTKDLAYSWKYKTLSKI